MKRLLLPIFCLLHVHWGYEVFKTIPHIRECFIEVHNDTETGAHYYTESDAVRSFRCVSQFIRMQPKTGKLHIPRVHNSTFEYVSYLFGKYTEDEGIDDFNEDNDYYKGGHAYNKRTGQRRCVRKEYRQLSKEEFDAVINCFWSLRRNKRLEPNVYDAIAHIHSRAAKKTIHDGQAFITWHMMYMMVMEFTLREECDPNMCLPYWDPRPDSRLPDPRTSSFFELYGGSNGPLSTPFTGWTMDYSGHKVVRNAKLGKKSSELFSYDDSSRIFKFVNTTSDLSYGSSPLDNIEAVIEKPHNTIHNFLGGTVKHLDIATNDPMFFAIHSYIELILSTATRLIQPQSARRLYPGGKYEPGHGPNDYMINLGYRMVGGKRKFFQNRDAYETRWRKYYTYAPPPSCKDGCEPKMYFYCCRGECIAYRKGSRKRESFCREKRKQKRYSDIASYHPSNEKLVQYPIWNDYVLNGRYSTNGNWVYVAVSITHHNLERNSEDTCIKYDYKTSSIWNIFRHTSSWNRFPRISQNCDPFSPGRILVYISAYSTNYRGIYDEHVTYNYQDTRCASHAYIGIRRPTKNSFTEVLFTANDHCGRMCRPYCPLFGSNPIRYKACAGMVRFDFKSISTYGLTLKEVTQNYRSLHKGAAIHHNVPYAISFMCDGFSHLF